MTDIKTTQTHTNSHKQCVTLQHPVRALIIGSSGSGKTMFCKHLIQHVLPTYDVIFVFSSTINDGGYDFIISEHKYFALTPKHLMTIQKYLTDAKRMGVHVRSLILIDDSSAIQGSIRTRYQTCYEELFSSIARHCDIDVLACFQNVQQTSTVLRSNCNFIVIFRLILERNRKSLTDFLANLLDDETVGKGQKPEEFLSKFINEATQDHGCIIVDFSKYTWQTAVSTYRVPAAS